jgi:hypothetical protein
VYPRALMGLLAVVLSCAACANEDAGETAAAPQPAAAATSSPSDQGNASPALAVLDRKVIKTGSLTLAVDAPLAAAAEARAVAERHGGYVLNSSTTASARAADDAVIVKVSLKVRADRFDAALTELRHLGSGSASESIESQDVSEEYVDVDARLRTHKRVEEQYLALLRDARNVSETLEVHKQLTGVRTEIERLQGKLRLLEHQVTLSTIHVTLQKARPLIAISGGRLGQAVEQAGVDAVNVAGAIVVFTIRAIGALIPFGLLLILPAVLLVRWAGRRGQERRALS